MKIRSVGAEFHVRTKGGQNDRQTDIMKVRIAIRNFANTPKSFSLCLALSLSLSVI
jgi:hypothetical protein